MPFRTDGRFAAGAPSAPHHANVRKRLLKSLETFMRDNGVLRTLLMIDDLEQLLGHPIAGNSWL